MGAQIGLAVVMVFLVGIRMYTRAVITKAFGWDDWSILGATALIIAQITGHGILVKDYGVGYHFIDQIQKFPDPDAKEKSYILGFIVSIFHCVAMFLIKMSILIFLYRLITVGKTRKVLKGITGFVAAFSIVWLFCIVFKCNPPDRFWKDKIYNESGQCNPQEVANTILPALSGVTDIMVWAVPIPAILKLQLPTREKVATIILFIIGSGSFIASFVRAAVFNEERMVTDGGRSIAMIALLAALEALVGVICASLFTIKPFLDRHTGSILSGSRSSNSRGSGSGTGSKGSQGIKGLQESDSDSTGRLRKYPSSSDGKLKIQVGKHVEVTRGDRDDYDEKSLC